MKAAASVDGVRTSAERELEGSGQAGSKKERTSTQERKHCLLIHFQPNNKQTKNYSPLVIMSQRITW